VSSCAESLTAAVSRSVHARSRRRRSERRPSRSGFDSDCVGVCWSPPSCDTSALVSNSRLRRSNRSHRSVLWRQHLSAQAPTCRCTRPARSLADAAYVFAVHSHESSQRTRRADGGLVRSLLALRAETFSDYWGLSAMSFANHVARNSGLNARRRKPMPEFDGLLCLVVTDLEAFTSWVSKLGDSRARIWIREHNRLMREALDQAGGHEVAHTGDGMIAAFRSLHSALRCTQQIQMRLAEYSRARRRAPLRARIGVHAGEPLPEEGRLFGACVNTSVRVCARAQAGQTLVTDVVRQLAQGRDFEFAEHGEARLKGLPQQLKLYELLHARETGAPTSCA
jgi:class 3 adenylate cyclase